MILRFIKFYRKVKACEEAGITVIRKVFDESAITLDITAYIRALNKSKSVDGILLQLPLRSGIDEQKCLEVKSSKMYLFICKIKEKSPCRNTR